MSLPVESLRIRQENPEVFYPDESIVVVRRGDIEALIAQSARNPRKRARLCTHSAVDKKIHEMLIVHEKGIYVRPHKHLNKSESFHIIGGEVDIILFDEDGAITRVMPMGAYESGLGFYYRLSEPVYHTLLIRSDVVVFHEATGGPFNREETVFPPWAPEEQDQAAVQEFTARTEREVLTVARGRIAGKEVIC